MAYEQTGDPRMLEALDAQVRYAKEYVHTDRGGGGYDGQQAIADNLLQLGMSFAGLIAYEDMRSAEFLATRPEVDSKRVSAMGLSVGSFRTGVGIIRSHIRRGRNMLDGNGQRAYGNRQQPDTRSIRLHDDTSRII